MPVAESPCQFCPKTKEWLAVLTDDRKAVQAVIKVVAVYGTEVDGFMLFPDDGPPVGAPVERCLPFVKPEKGGWDEVMP